jgi:hypothetical protein
VVGGDVGGVAAVVGADVAVGGGAVSAEAAAVESVVGADVAVVGGAVSADVAAVGSVVDEVPDSSAPPEQAVTSTDTAATAMTNLFPRIIGA